MARRGDGAGRPLGARAAGMVAAALALVALVARATSRGGPGGGPRDAAGAWPQALRLSVEDAARVDRAADLRLPPMPEFSAGTVFVGHLVPDVDSIASAVAAAHLFGGTAMRAGPVNSESAFLLDHFGLPEPALLDDAYKGEPFVLVDHNAFAQRAKALDAAKIVGIFDHHAISSTPTLVPQPIYVNVRPWGSCSTVIATKFLEYRRPLPPAIAGLLMGGIVSDTLNLRSPTTTSWDGKVLLWLASMLKWRSPNRHKHGLVLGADLSAEALRANIDAFAHRQFQAKANTTSMSLKEVVLSDFKVYLLPSLSLGGAQLVLGWGTIETVQPFYDGYLKPAVLQKLVLETMPAVQEERQLEALFVSIVDIERRESAVVCATKETCAVMRKALPDAAVTRVPRAPEGQVLRTSPRVSRKEEFLPALRKALRKSARHP